MCSYTALEDGMTLARSITDLRHMQQMVTTSAKTMSSKMETTTMAAINIYFLWLQRNLSKEQGSSSQFGTIFWVIDELAWRTRFYTSCTLLSTYALLKWAWLINHVGWPNQARVTDRIFSKAEGLIGPYLGPPGADSGEESNFSCCLSISHGEIFCSRKTTGILRENLTKQVVII